MQAYAVLQDYAGKYLYVGKILLQSMCQITQNTI